MHFSNAFQTVATALAIASQASGFVIDVYNSEDCTGDSRSVNVWDNTCATWMGGFSSYKPTTYGGPHQKSYFYVPGSCGDIASAFSVHWVDGGDDGFKIGACYNFGADRSINAVSSYWAAG